MKLNDMETMNSGFYITHTPDYRQFQPELREVPQSYKARQ